MQNTQTIEVYQLNCFTMEQPFVCQINEHILTIVDGHNQLYKLALKQYTSITPSFTLSLRKDSIVKNCSSFVIEDRQYIVLLFQDGKLQILKGQYEEVCFQNVKEYVIKKQQSYVVLRFYKRNEKDQYEVQSRVFSPENSQQTNVSKEDEFWKNINFKTPYYFKPQADLIVNGNVIRTKAKIKILDFLHKQFDKIITTNLHLTICKSKTNEYYVYENQDKWQQLDPSLKFIHMQIIRSNGVDIVYGIHQNQNKTQIILYGKKQGSQTNFVKIASLPLNIQSPQFIHQINSQNITLLDKSSLTLFKIQLASFLREGGKVKEDESNVHDSIRKNLQYRKKCLKVLKKYLQENDWSSTLRYLDCCENSSVLNDGIVMLCNYLKQKYYAEGLLKNSQNCQKLLQLCVKILESKYESHIENSLHLLMNFHQIVSMNKNDRQIIKKLKQIGNGKRMKKLTQQTKKKKLFQLAYQYVNIVNSQHLAK